MHLTLETHSNTLCDTQQSTLQLFDELDTCDNIGICFQPYTEQDTDAAIQMYDILRPHIRHVHLQNRRRVDGSITRLEEGDWLDYRRLLPHIRDSGFDGPLSLEFTTDMATPDSPNIDSSHALENASRDRDFTLEMWSAQLKSTLKRTEKSAKLRMTYIDLSICLCYSLHIIILFVLFYLYPLL